VLVSVYPNVQPGGRLIVVIAYFVLMDLVLALMPIKLVRNLNRPLRERILICCLMALGLCATVIAGVKMTTFNDVGLGDALYGTFFALSQHFVTY
jgi:hypothetical protein